MGIKELADSIVKKYKSSNPFEILKGMNVIIVFTPLEYVRGFYQYYERNNIIYIRDDLSYSEKLFVCAHEMGHLLLHKKENVVYMDTKTDFNTAKYEIEANLFASCLLIPDEAFEQCTGYTISQFSRFLGYDEKIIKLRMQLIGK